LVDWIQISKVSGGTYDGDFINLLSALKISVYTAFQIIGVMMLENGLNVSQ
jgi:hypothetical protein